MFWRTASRSIMIRNFVVLTMAAWAFAQSTGDEVHTRQLWNQEMRAKRPASPQAPAVKKLPANKEAGTLLGITVWRLRPSKSGEASAIRALVHEDAGDEEWTPERVRSDTPLGEGQKVIVSSEATQEGYLYIIDRDEYADGTQSTPTLIFPTLRTRSGHNHISPGVVVSIPAPDDKPSYFTVKHTRPDQVNEVLTFLITPTPLAELTITREQLKLSNEQVARWTKQSKVTSYKLEDAAHEGKIYSVEEKEAARGGRLLTKDDPLPQTMYRVKSKPGDPVMLDVRLKISQ